MGIVSSTPDEGSVLHNPKQRCCAYEPYPRIATNVTWVNSIVLFVYDDIQKVFNFIISLDIKENIINEES